MEIAITGSDDTCAIDIDPSKVPYGVRPGEVAGKTTEPNWDGFEGGPEPRKRQVFQNRQVRGDCDATSVANETSQPPHHHGCNTGQGAFCIRSRRSGWPGPKCMVRRACANTITTMVVSRPKVCKAVQSSTWDDAERARKQTLARAKPLDNPRHASPLQGGAADDMPPNPFQPPIKDPQADPQQPSGGSAAVDGDKLNLLRQPPSDELGRHWLESRLWSPQRGGLLTDGALHEHRTRLRGAASARFARGTAARRDGEPRHQTESFVASQERHARLTSPPKICPDPSVRRAAGTHKHANENAVQ